MPQLLGDLSPYRRKGDKVSLTCLASGGNPLPELTWMRNGLPLRDSGKPMLLLVNDCYFSKILNIRPIYRILNSHSYFYQGRSRHRARVCFRKTQLAKHSARLESFYLKLSKTNQQMRSGRC